jgi:uncharacterized protein (TIGR03435 family)
MRIPSSIRRLDPHLPVYPFCALVLTGVTAIPLLGGAQSPLPMEFDVVSIKRVEEPRPEGGMRTLPDGTFMMMNQPLGTLVNAASPVPVTLRTIEGMPGWMMRESYDVTVKPPEGLTREQIREAMPAMWRAMFAVRMKLVAHVEQRERDAYALLLARSDGRLGPQMKPSTLDCAPRAGATPPAPPQTVPSVEERQNRCGMSMSRGLFVSGGVTLDHDLLDSPVANTRLSQSGLRKPLCVVILLQFDEREHLRAGGHERKARVWVVAGQGEGSIDESCGNRHIAGEEEAIADRTQVPKLAANVTELPRRVQGLLDSLGRLAGVAPEEGNHPQLAVRAVLPRGVAKLPSQFANLLPISKRGQDVPFQIDIALDGEAPEPQARVVRNKGLRQIDGQIL